MVEHELTSQEMEEQYLQMFGPSMEERIEELEYETRELQEKVQKLENLIDKWQGLFFKLYTT